MGANVCSRDCAQLSFSLQCLPPEVSAECMRRALEKLLQIRGYPLLLEETLGSQKVGQIIAEGLGAEMPGEGVGFPFGGLSAIVFCFPLPHSRCYW